MNDQSKQTTDAGAAISAGVGAVAGSSGVLVAVAAGGPVVGLGAAGITSGLAAVGGVVGGGMAAGLCVVAAAPLVAAGVAFGAYKLYTYRAER